MFDGAASPEEGWGHYEEHQVHYDAREPIGSIGRGRNTGREPTPRREWTRSEPPAHINLSSVRLNMQKATGGTFSTAIQQ